MTPSFAPGAAQRDARHARETQSSATRHIRPTSHEGDDEPPQSTSVSSPFRTRSARGAAHSPPSHTRLAQSRPVRHPLPSPHEGACVPPQSTADSSPFMTPSSGRGARHRPSTQTRSAQSRRVAHARPSPQRGPTMPPQSTSVSSPFRTPSLALEGAHTPARVHTPDAHAEPRVHSTPRQDPTGRDGLGAASLGASAVSGATEHDAHRPTRITPHIVRRTKVLTAGVRGGATRVAPRRRHRIFYNQDEHLRQCTIHPFARHATRSRRESAHATRDVGELRDLKKDEHAANARGLDRASCTGGNVPKRAHFVRPRRKFPLNALCMWCERRHVPHSFPSGNTRCSRRRLGALRRDP